MQLKFSGNNKTLCHTLLEKCMLSLYANERRPCPTMPQVLNIVCPRVGRPSARSPVFIIALVMCTCALLSISHASTPNPSDGKEMPANLTKSGAHKRADPQMPL